MSNNFAVDQELLNEFISESLEALDELDQLFVLLEDTPDDLGLIDQVFRPIHSIKGNSSFFGLVNIKNFSHVFESILQEIRSEKRIVTPALVDLLLKSTDLLKNMLRRFAEGENSTDLLPEETANIQEIEKLLNSSGVDIATVSKNLQKAIKEVLVFDFPPELKVKVEQASSLFSEVLNEVTPSITSSSAIYLIGENDVTENISFIKLFVNELATASEDKDRSKEFIRCIRKCLQLAQEISQAALIRHLNSLANDFTTISESGIGFDEVMTSLIKERYEDIMKSIKVSHATATTTQEVETPTKKITETPKEGTTAKETPNNQSDKEYEKKDQTLNKTLRIEEEKVDDFMSYVGELIIASEVFAYLQKKLEGFPNVRDISQEFKHANIIFNELSNNLQKSLMTVRRLPLKSIIKKLPRITRDSATKTGKKVKLIVKGDETLIDKSLIEGLEAPLVHMIRNSVDHGIESPENRVAKGKDETGTITLLAEADEETFKLYISDDGNGIDLEKVKAKAVKSGIISEQKALSISDQDAADMIFSAGLSTAQEVTDLSGRGVGMDVVHSNIEKLGGTVSIETCSGKGSCFTITLPMAVTLMVVDGLVARVGNDNYIIPISDVRESIRPLPKDFTIVAGKGETIKVRDQLHRLLRLNKILGVESNTDSFENTTVIIIEYRGTRCGLLVDEVIGQQSVVQKDIGPHFEALKILRGGAILGDGRIGLILDTEGLIMELSK